MMRLTVFSILLTVALLSIAVRTEAADSVKLQGKVDVVADACAAAGVTLSRNTLPALVEGCGLGTPAAYAGVRKGDRVVSGKIEEDRIVLNFERKGKVYQARLATTPQMKMVPKEDKPSIPELPVKEDPVFEGTIADKDLELLAKHNVAIVIDRSGSMSEAAFSHSTTNSQSKWDWCGKQASALAEELSRISRTITMATFNHTYQIKRRCDAFDVTEAFSSLTPQGYTDPGEPIGELLRSCMEDRRKKWIIAVVTDGLPNRGRKLQDVIIEATKNMQDKDQITMAFLTIGDDAGGDALLRELDTGLVRAGAQFDVVASKSFSQVQSLGLKRALVDAIKNK
ncbi:MAG: VWA domain-containing protein [Candidatus Obscuribacterales bacterium]|nr:VWA domain-containing protein [Candidatus Obscuribacterales bacterium]